MYIMLIKYTYKIQIKSYFCDTVTQFAFFVALTYIYINTKYVRPPNTPLKEQKQLCAMQ